jgi:phage FluMu protein Com/DNA-directed RNA polymerase subunit RPC12/RpoP
MAHSCPNCGSELQYTEVAARLLTGTCAGCGDEVTVVAGAGVAPGSAIAGATEPAAPAAAPGPDAPHCPECDGPLLVRVSGDASLEVECPECETTTQYLRQGENAVDDEAVEERPRRPPRGSFAPERRGPPRGPAGPGARPCRQCGAPLTFSNDDDGNLVGECSSCGNRFVLPPRTEGPRGGGGGGYRDRGGYRGGGNRYGGGGPRGGGDRPRRSYGGPPSRSRPRTRDGDDDDDDRRRRRPRRY